jgi:putative effector of murein hydrolase LrgA (UPF0299 family)
VLNNRDVWHELQQRRRPLTVHGAIALLIVPVGLLVMQLRDCVRRGWWPRSTADAALFCLMVSAVVFVVGTFVGERWRARRERRARRRIVR